MLRRGFGECLFVLVIGVVVLGQLLLNGLNPLNQQLHLRLWWLPQGSVAGMGARSSSLLE